MNLLIVSLVIFALAAVFGLVILLRILKGDATPKPAVFVHGLLAAVGLGHLIYYVVNNIEKPPTTSLVILLVAALGGFFLFFMDMAKKPLPKSVALIHAGAAVVGVVMLVLFIIGI
ncbi:MAG TPA: hypothetical protein VF691_00685 [Cytophagaceae bacterium]